MSQDIVERIGELRAALTELQDHVESAIGAAGASRRYEDFVRAVTDWVWETDANLNYVYVSDGIAAVFGVPAAVMEGRYLFALSHFRQIDEPVQDLFETIEKHRTFRDVALNIEDSTGRSRRILLSGLPIFDDATGRFAGFRGTGIDLTDRGAAPGTGASAATSTARPSEHMPGYWRLDCQTKALSIARDVSAALSLRPDEVPKTLEAWCGLIDAGDRARFNEALDGLIAGRAPKLEIEFRLATRPGGAHWLILSAQAERASTGTALFVHGMCTDISTHKAREAALASETAAAELANRAKTLFLTNLSHELRTPLNAIIGFSEAIKEGYLGPLSVEKSREYAADVFTASSHLLELINDVLDISKVEAGQIELSEAALDVADIIEQSVRLVEGRAADGWVRLGVEVAADLPKLLGDTRFIKQILVNLLANAVKFTDKDGLVRIQAGLTDDGGIRIAVIDTGVGMDPADIPKALSPFGQIAGKDSDIRAEGTGLGLPLAKSLTELHGGVLSIDSARGRGTTASVSFPPERSVG